MIVNTDQRLYVMPTSDGKGYTCLGFDVAYDKASKYAAFVQVEAPNPALIGTTAGYEDYQRCLHAAQQHATTTHTQCTAFLSPQLTGLEGRRVEVVTTYGETWRFQVGKSTGWAPCHLEVARRISTGSMAADIHYKTVRVIR